MRAVSWQGSTHIFLAEQFGENTSPPRGFVAGPGRPAVTTRLRATTAARASSAPVPTRPPGRARLGLPPGAAPRPRPSALRAARQRRRHAEIPEVPPRRPPGHAEARPSPPPSALRPPRAPGFPVHRPNPLLLGATRRQNLPPLALPTLLPRPGYCQARRQTKEPRENLPELQRKSLIQSFLGLTFNFKNNKSRNQKPPRLEVGVRGNARGRRLIPSAAFAPPFSGPCLGL